MKETHGPCPACSRGAAMSSSAPTPTRTSTSPSCLTASGRLAELFIPAALAGCEHLLTFSLRHIGENGRLAAFGVEGTGSYGIGLARFLRNHRHTVREVARPPRRGERRMSGKSDAIDAEHAARQVLASIDMPVPKSANGQVEAIRLIKIARDSTVKARSTTMITLKATLVTADVELRCELEHHPPAWPAWLRMTASAR